LTRKVHLVFIFRGKRKIRARACPWKFLSGDKEKLVVYGASQPCWRKTATWSPQSKKQLVLTQSDSLRSLQDLDKSCPWKFLSGDCVC